VARSFLNCVPLPLFFFFSCRAPPNSTPQTTAVDVGVGGLTFYCYKAPPPPASVKCFGISPGGGWVGGWVKGGLEKLCVWVGSGYGETLVKSEKGGGSCWKRGGKSINRDCPRDGCRCSAGHCTAGLGGAWGGAVFNLGGSCNLHPVSPTVSLFLAIPLPATGPALTRHSLFRHSSSVDFDSLF
jgi:hypothetical protein